MSSFLRTHDRAAGDRLGNSQQRVIPGLTRTASQGDLEARSPRFGVLCNCVARRGFVNAPAGVDRLDSKRSNRFACRLFVREALGAVQMLAAELLDYALNRCG